MPPKYYIFYGNENYLIEKKIKQLAAKISDQEMNLESFDGEKAEVADIASALTSSTLLGGDRLILVKPADLSDKKWDALVPFLEKDQSNNLLIMVADGLSAKSKITQFIEKKGEVQEFKTFAEWEEEELVAWVTRQEKCFSRAAAQRLVEICGNDLQKLSSEIEKIVTFCGVDRQISAQDVETMASPGESNVFKLLDALSQKKSQQALSVLNILLRNKADIFPMLSLMAQQYRVMLYIRSKAGRMDSYEIARQLEVKPFFVKKCLVAAKTFSPETLKNNIKKILDTDLALKTGHQVFLNLELLVADLCEN